MNDKEQKVSQETDLLRALGELEKKNTFIWIIFSVAAMASLLNGINSLSYVFLAEIPEFRCSVSDLVNTNWTFDQIKKISKADECHQYDHNYTYLTNLKYDEAIEYVNGYEFMPSIISCKTFMFNETGRSSIVNEWQLVCEKKLYRANTYVVYVLGKMCGLGIFGVYADLYGRKYSLIISIFLQIIAEPASALVPGFWEYLVLRFITGVGLGAMYSSAYTLMSEATNNRKRKLLVAAIECIYALGIFCLVLTAYLIPHWRNLQLALSCFVLPAIILVWFVPESPRWLISQGRHDEAQKIIQKYCGSTVTIPICMTIENLSTKPPPETPTKLKEKTSFFNRDFESLKILFSDSILRKNILIVYFIAYATAAVSYSLVFSIDNFKTDRYIYMSIVVVNELLSHMAVSMVLMFLSCRKANIIILINVFIVMMGLLAVPEEDKNTIIGLALFGKFLTAATYTINLLLVAELFPSTVKNSALGTSLIMVQLGSTSAPFIVDLLGNVAWWTPTTLCGILALIAALFCILLPQKN
ncbi:GSCOCG00001717001-RA-CDS [Cotesia congregata]|nr:GSCOCG00001717001-RA-CDS [Cotesia congregata]